MSNAGQGSGLSLPTFQQVVTFIEAESVPIGQLIALAGAAIRSVQRRQGAGIDAVELAAETAANIAEDVKLKGK